MNKHYFWRAASLMTALAMLISPFGLSSSASAAPTAKDQPAGSGPQTIYATFSGVSKPVSSMPTVEAAQGALADPLNVPNRLEVPRPLGDALASSFDASIVQSDLPTLNMPTTVANFEGVNNRNGVLPPDTTGDVGINPATGTKYYMQWVNASFQIWDVTNPAAPTTVAGPLAGNSLWAGTGTLCDSHNDGDPIVLYDHLANRWMISQFAISFPNNFHECIAVSTSADPTSTWYLYDFQTSTTVMNDYPKLGVWADGYYMSVNQFDGVTQNWAGAGVFVFERSAMLSGLSARMLYFDLGAITKNYGNLLPSDLDGSAPIAGTPNVFVEWDDSTWLGDANDTLRLWEFKPDWTNTANTTFGLNANFDPNQKISTANVDPNMCNYARSCIAQKGVTAKLDAISGQLMHRLQFRNINGTFSLVGNHTVDATSTDRAGVHWFELHNTGTGWHLNQEGVFAPADSENRWMASAAMDMVGNIAVGYSVSSTATYPSIRYTGRLVTDTLGTMTQGEATLIAGGGSQTHTAARWGDYSTMSVDPVDECTFWYTQEYYAATTSAGWQTRIGSFKFPSCTAAPTGTLQGTVTGSVGSLAISGATVSVTGGYSTLTNASGFYQLSLPVGTYSVSASNYGYTTSSVSGISVTTGGTTTQDFVLTPSGTFTISGTVKDATTGWPLYTYIGITGYPSGGTYTNPVTGAYSVQLPAGAYTFSASSMVPGYVSKDQGVSVSGNATQNIVLNANLTTCTAPGYALGTGTTQNFDSWPLSGWTIINNQTGTLVWDSNTNVGMANYTGGSGTAATASSDIYGTGIYDTELRSPVYNPASLASMNLYYKANYQDYSSFDALDLDITTNGGTNWTNVTHWISDHGILNSTGENVAVDLSTFASTPFQLRWRYYSTDVSAFDWYAQIDDVNVGAVCSVAATKGLVIGVVKDANTSTDIVNFSVKDAALKSAAIIDASADPNRLGRELYVIAEEGGARSLTASTPGYNSVTTQATAVAKTTIRQDFSLPAGRLNAAPTSLTFNVPLYAPTAFQSLTISNTGTAQGSYEVFAVLGAAPSAPVPTGPFANHTRHVGPKNMNDTDARNLRVNLTPLNVPLLPAGNVTSSWDTNLASAWGIGYNTAANDMWIGSPDQSYDYRFLPSGFTNGDGINLASWAAIYSADMTYNPFTKSLWQVNVGGDTCIYELNPTTKTSTGTKICPAFGTSERGLAFDPVSNTYYAGSWTDGILNHFSTNGTLLDSVDVGLSISGLAFNPSTGHLFAMTNSATTTDTAIRDVYVLDTNNSYAVVGSFNLQEGTTKVFADYEQAGLEIDCNGNLWAVNQVNRKVYKADSGETGVCSWQLASWITATPGSATISNSSSAPLSVYVNASGLKYLTTYQAHLRITTNTPYGNVVVPVTLNVGQTFIDVPSNHWANTFIQRLYWNGVTTGCAASPLTYCPETNVTRAQMAVFLLRSKHGSSYTPPAATGTVFSDVPANAFAAAWIEELKAEGITGGCSATAYCPNDQITRAQMAVFLLRAHHGSAYNPPLPSGSMFNDVPTNAFAAAWIEQLSTEGITSGCGTNLYCPGNPVTRAQMAVFLIKNFSLP